MASLVADYGDSSPESSNETSSSTSENDETFEELVPSESRLPPPAFTDKVKNSVFVNPYLEAENAKIALLEKHVKMVPIQKQKAGTESKVCWMFKKGSCRYGKKCKFVHVMTPAEGADDVLAEAPVGGKSPRKVRARKEPENRNAQSVDEDDDEPQKKKMKRPGLAQGLVPSKRVMKMYQKQKDSDNQK